MQTYLNDKDRFFPLQPPGLGRVLRPCIYPKYVGTRRIFQSPFDKRPLGNRSGTGQLRHQPQHVCGGRGKWQHAKSGVTRFDIFLWHLHYNGNPGHAPRGLALPPTHPICQ